MMKLTSDLQEILKYNYEVTHIFLYINLKIRLYECDYNFAHSLAWLQNVACF